MSKDLPKFSFNLDDNHSRNEKKANTLKKIPNGIDSSCDVYRVNNNGCPGEQNSHGSIVNGAVCGVKHVCCSQNGHQDGNKVTTCIVCTCQGNMDSLEGPDNTEKKLGGASGSRVLQENSHDKLNNIQNNLGSDSGVRVKIQRCFSDGVLTSNSERKQISSRKCDSLSDTCMCSVSATQSRNNIPVSSHQLTVQNTERFDGDKRGLNNLDDKRNNFDLRVNSGSESDMCTSDRPNFIPSVNHTNGLDCVVVDSYCERNSESRTKSLGRNNANKPKENTLSMNVSKTSNNLQFCGDSRVVNNCIDDSCDICEYEMNMIFGSPIDGLQNGHAGTQLPLLSDNRLCNCSVLTNHHESSSCDADGVSRNGTSSSVGITPNCDGVTETIASVVAPLALPEDISEYDSDGSCDENLECKQASMCDCDTYGGSTSPDEENCDKSGNSVTDTVKNKVSCRREDPGDSSEDNFSASACGLPNEESSSQGGDQAGGATAAVQYDIGQFQYEPLPACDSSVSSDLPSQRRRRLGSSVESLEDIGDYIEADLPPRSERLAFFSRGSSSSTTTDEDEGCGEDVILNNNEESDNETINPLMTCHEFPDQHYRRRPGFEPCLSWQVPSGAEADPVLRPGEMSDGRYTAAHHSSSETDYTSAGLAYSMSDLSEVTSTDAESGMESVFPSASTSSSCGAFVQYGFQGDGYEAGHELDSSPDSFFPPGHNYSLDSAAFYLPRQNLSLDYDHASDNTMYGESFNRRSRSLDQDLVSLNRQQDAALNTRSFEGEGRNGALSGSNFLHDDSNLQEKVFQKLTLQQVPHESCSSDEEENNSPRQGRVFPSDSLYNRYPGRGRANLEYNRNLLGQVPHTPIEQNIVVDEEEPIYEDIDELQLSEDTFCSDSEPDNTCPVPAPCTLISKQRRRGKQSVNPVSDVKKVMIWHEYEAFAVQVKEIGASACGPTAVLNALKAFDIQVDTEEVVQSVVYNTRMEAAPIPYYLFSRSSAGATAEALVAGMSRLTRGVIKGRVFHFYPARDVQLLKWLGEWMQKGAVPVATLNLQRGVKPGWAIPDAWHHQMIYGVSHKGVYLTNPLELVAESVIMEQLCSDSVLLVRRQDVVSRFRDWCPLNEILKQRDPRWRTMNVLGQVIHVLRERCTPPEQLPLLPSQLTSHVKIPAVYKAGITLFMRSNTPGFEELMKVPELPLKQPDQTVPPHL